ncbi:carbohydrate-binding module family 13 protein [Rhizophagus irregularis DAOM 181602=DAOM 197198]|nr:carbohydrate-binding module family 13 protein [Rhizophagus irregularis DAOM 181602=DAOM 197198]
MILRYIYGGRLSLEEYDTSDIIKILIAANELNQSDNKPESKIITKEINSKSIDSKIITFQHAELISKWINRLENTDKMNSPYEFKLILRGSRDGFSPRKFHKICDYQPHTISIIKVKDSDEIFGGYNPIIWKSDHGSFGTTKDSFIFSFKNKENVEENILSRAKYEEYAICNDSNFGSAFGCYEFVLCGGDNMGAETVCYGSVGEFSKSSVEEYEVFQIMNN